MSGPFYGCDQGDCSSEMTYPASDLMIYKGEVWCEGCLEYEHGGDAYKDTTAFVPPDDIRIMALEAKGRLQKKSIDSQKHVLEELRKEKVRLADQIKRTQGYEASMAEQLLAWRTLGADLLKTYAPTHSIHQMVKIIMDIK